jgi:hypothetical protein
MGRSERLDQITVSGFVPENLPASPTIQHEHCLLERGEVLWKTRNLALLRLHRHTHLLEKDWWLAKWLGI